MLKLYISDVSGLDIESASALLPPDRYEKMKKLRRSEDKKLSAGAYLLFRRASELNGLSPDYTVGLNGKPDYSASGMHFSISHSGCYAVCAVSDKTVGVDIERPRHGSLKLAERFFAADELDHLKSCGSPDDEFCRIWTMKESFIKAYGLNLSELGGFSVLDSRCCSYCGFTFNGYHISVCTAEEDSGAELTELYDLC